LIIQRIRSYQYRLNNIKRPGFQLKLIKATKSSQINLAAFCFMQAYCQLKVQPYLCPFNCVVIMWYEVLNIFFFIFHTAFTIFNIAGWAFKLTRKWHLITLLITAFSWFVLGIWYGWGYCLCTDWHWSVRKYLGYHDISRSYIHFLILKLTGINLDPQLVEKSTLVLFLLNFALSIWFNLKDKRKQQQNS